MQIMKNQYIYLILIIFFSISILKAQDKSEQSKSDNQARLPAENAVQDTLYFQVFGMDCPGCHGTLEKQVNKLNAVDHSKGDWVNQEVMIIVKKDSVLIERELFEKIEKANFTPGIKVNK